MQRPYFLSFNCRSEWLILIAALLSVAGNFLFIGDIAALDVGMPTVVIALVLFAAFVIVYSLLLVKYAAKPVLTLIILGSVPALYFMSSYNIAIDKIMMLNVLETDQHEIEALLTPKMLVFMIFFAFLPIYALWRAHIVYSPFLQETRKRACLILLTSLPVLIIIWLCRPDFAMLRENKHVLYRLLPSNYISSAVSISKVIGKSHRIKKITKDGTRERYWRDPTRKNAIIVILGESARSASFSLNGYARATNRELEAFADELMVFKRTQACGTQTAVSVPCLFSPLERKEFSKDIASYTENVLDVLQHNGYNILWRENNSSCKGVCSRIPTEVFCDGISCLDDEMQKNLPAKIKSMPGDAVVVLHQGGSHGPNYYERYPDEFEVFKPVCKKNDLSLCSSQEIINAYDNSILYTSHLLAELFTALKPLQDEYNIVVIYTSDHGESLGEKGIYLHSAYYDTAPHYQKEVPFLVWMPKETAAAMRYERACLKTQAERQISHDYFFHSLLGLAGITTADYRAGLDIFAPCRKSQNAGLAKSKTTTISHNNQTTETTHESDFEK